MTADRRSMPDCLASGQNGLVKTHGRDCLQSRRAPRTSREQTALCKAAPLCARPPRLRERSAARLCVCPAVHPSGLGTLIKTAGRTPFSDPPEHTSCFTVEIVRARPSARHQVSQKVPNLSFETAPSLRPNA